MWFFFSPNHPPAGPTGSSEGPRAGEVKGPDRSRRRGIVPSLGTPRSHWPVVGWIRLRLPPQPAPVMLTPGTPPPPEPPLDFLLRNPVATDPRKRVFAYEEERGSYVLRLAWDADDPDYLEAECRKPLYGARLPPGEVAEFWAAVKALVGPTLGPLRVDSADPRPPRGPS